MKIAVLGLGRMGRLIVDKLLDGGHSVVAWNRSLDSLEKISLEKKDLVEKGVLQTTQNLEDLKKLLDSPRIVWSMLPSGEVTETVLDTVSGFWEKGDILIDGGNSHFKDTEKRSKQFETKGIKFMGIGVSGGVHAKKNGCCIMVGGSRETYEYLRPVLDTLASPHGTHTYFGPGGAGHFVKMVHNGIEYGMMQAIAEGFGVLKKSDYDVDLKEVARNYQRGSIVSSFLIDCVESAFEKDGNLSDTSGVIGANGEGKWTVETAKELGVPAPVIENSLKFRDDSATDPQIKDSFTAKVVQAMRFEFGGHKK